MEKEKQQTRKLAQKKTLEDANSRKTPGTDGVDKEFPTRYWSMLGQTIQFAQKTYIENEKLNKFLYSGLIKILQKGGTKLRTDQRLETDHLIKPNLQVYKWCSSKKNKEIPRIIDLRMREGLSEQKQYRRDHNQCP